MRYETCAPGPRPKVSRTAVLVMALLFWAAAPYAVEQAADRPLPPSPMAENDGIILNFKDAPLETVLAYLSEAAGFVIVGDVGMESRVTIISRQPLAPQEAVDLLNTVLKEEGFAALRMGRTLKILPLSEAKQANIPVRAGNDPDALEPSDSLVTQVVPLRFVDAARLSQDLAPLVPAYADISANASSNALILTDTAANVQRLMQIVRALDTHLGAVTEVRVFALEYASAVNAAKLVNEVFKEEPAAQQQQAATRVLRRFRGPGGDGDADSGEGRPSQKVTASADERTNTVVVSGPPDVLKVVETVIRELDANPIAEQAVFTYHLKNAKAENLERVLNELFESESSAQAQSSSAGGRRSSARRSNQQASAGTAETAAELAGEVRVVADEDSNSLMVMTAQKNFARVREIISELDRAVPQVLIKVLLAEVTHSNSRDLGAEFSVLNLRASGRGASGLTDFAVANQSGGLIFRLLEKDVTATLRALEEEGKLDVLSRPYILASDNQAASITVGQEVPFIRNTRVTETGQTINTIEYEDIGIILQVTPHINPEGLVILDVVPEISTLTGESVPISETVDAPVFAKRSAQSRVAIQDGQTIVIGGLMEDQKTETIRKVPMLGDVPYLGRLFRRTIKESAKTELLIFLTPHVAQQPTALEPMSDEEMRGSEVVPGAVGPGVFDKHLEGMRRGAGLDADPLVRPGP